MKIDFGAPPPPEDPGSLRPAVVDGGGRPQPKGWAGRLLSEALSLRGPRLMVAVITAGFLLSLLWASFAQLEEVTRGQGQVMPTSKTQIIQSAEAATVKSILVRSGESVRAGQLLVRLDDTQSASELGQIQAENRT